MFVYNAWFGEQPVTARQEELFAAAYGPVEIDPGRLAYYPTTPGSSRTSTR